MTPPPFRFGDVGPSPDKRVSKGVDDERRRNRCANDCCRNTNDLIIKQHQVCAEGSILDAIYRGTEAIAHTVEPGEGGGRVSHLKTHPQNGILE